MHPAIGRCPFCENYAKFYFDAKHLEKLLNGGGGGGMEFWCPFFANIRHCPNFPD